MVNIVKFATCETTKVIARRRRRRRNNRRKFSGTGLSATKAEAMKSAWCVTRSQKENGKQHVELVSTIDGRSSPRFLTWRATQSYIFRAEAVRLSH